MAKVYVLLTGCYGDQVIAGVFTNEGAANQLSYQIYDSTVYECELDPIVPRKPEGLNRYAIHVRPDVTISYVNLELFYDLPAESDMCDSYQRYANYGEPYWACFVWARTEEEATKRASDYVLSILSCRLDQETKME